MDLAGQSVVVVGLARSGVAAARFLAARGARVVATDRKGEGVVEAEVLTLRDQGITLELGGHRQATFTAASLVVVSPGVPWDLPELDAARRAGVPVVAEIELAYRQLRGTVVAITGTKGKSTTTAALGAMLRERFADVRVGGNIGAPLTGLVDGATDTTLFVVEVSSFQLEGIAAFRPHVAAFLNVSPDHLDRHPDFAAYLAAKARVFENQGPEDWAVVNADDPAVMAEAARGRARLLRFRASGAWDGDGAFFDAGTAWLRRDGRLEALFALSAVRLPGAHLAADLLAAAAIARLLGATPAEIARAVAGFGGIEHVLERVAEADGIAYFNDSKATNVDAARKSLEAFDRPVVALMGGRYKGGDFASLRDLVAARARGVVAFGEAADRIVEALGGATDVRRAASLAEAVRAARALARPGDVVLLAPACSSFDMFRDYAERGRAFKTCVGELVSRG